MTYLLQARSTTRDVWVRQHHDGRFVRGQWQLPDGSDIRDLIADGDTARLGFVPRFVRENRGTRIGDLLWTTGHSKIASRRFVDTLESIGATGYRTCPVEVLRRDGSSLGDFVGFAVLGGDPAHDLRFSNGFQSFRFRASARIVDALHAAGVTDLSIEAASQALTAAHDGWRRTRRQRRAGHVGLTRTHDPGILRAMATPTLTNFRLRQSRFPASSSHSTNAV